jgi:hypothetical protein
MSVSLLMGLDANGNKIIGRVITQLAARPNVMDLKILHAPAPLTTPSVSLQNFPAKLAIRFRIKPQPGPLCSDPSQNVTCTSSNSCFLCGFGRPLTSRVKQGNKASRLPASKLTPARKSAQIISRQ